MSKAEGRSSGAGVAGTFAFVGRCSRSEQRLFLVHQTINEKRPANEWLAGRSSIFSERRWDLGSGIVRALGPLRTSAFASFTTTTTATLTALTTLTASTATRTKAFGHLFELGLVDRAVVIGIREFNESLAFWRKLVLRDLPVFVLIHCHHALDEFGTSATPASSTASATFATTATTASALTALTARTTTLRSRKFVHGKGTILVAVELHQGGGSILDFGGRQRTVFIGVQKRHEWMDGRCAALTALTCTALAFTALAFTALPFTALTFTALTALAFATLTSTTAFAATTALTTTTAFAVRSLRH
jgi:hypothetical protein